MTLIGNANANAEDQLDLIERSNFQKKVAVRKMMDKNVGQLRDYQTFSFYLAEKLIFCHLSKNGSEPRVICH